MYGKKGKGSGKKKKGGKRSLLKHSVRGGKGGGDFAPGHCDVHGPNTSKGGMPCNEKHS